MKKRTIEDQVYNNEIQRTKKEIKQEFIDKSMEAGFTKKQAEFLVRVCFDF